MVAEMTYGNAISPVVPLYIYTGFKSVGDMVWVPDHIHYRDVGSVKSIDYLFWRHYGTVSD